MSAGNNFIAWMGCTPYLDALDLQLQICEQKKRGLADDFLLLLEHPPTLTLGRSGTWQNLIVSDEVLESRGVQRYEVDRGGDITFHGPGQLVGYPILKLERAECDVRRYMRNLEQCLIQLLSRYSIECGRDERYTGVWTPAGKIAAMGVHISRWVTRHGIALNVNTDLSYYDLIVPCGIAGKRVTSMQALLNRPLELLEVAQRFAAEFGAVFGRNMRWLSSIEMREMIGSFAHSGALA